MGPADHNWSYNSRQRNLVAITTFCIVISTIAVGLRLLARHHFRVSLWWDDYIAIVALIFSYFPNILTIMGLRAGLGRHATDVTPEGARYIGVTVYVHQMTWYISFTAILLTILILYVRIFPISWLRRACRASGYFSLVWMIVNIIVLTFQCTPVEYFWKHDRPGGGHCIHTNEYYAIACGVSMGMLILVFLLPLPIIRNLQITRHKKWGLAAAFTVGVFACVASVLRLILVLDIDPKDMSYSIAPAILWGCLEISVGVVSACVPSMMPLLLLVVGKRHGSKDNSGKSGGYLKYENGKYPHNNESKTAHSNRLHRFISTQNLETLPEAMDVTILGETQVGKEDDDDIQLMERNKKPGTIMVTNQISVSEAKSIEKPNPVAPTNWNAQYPANAHLR